MRGRTIGEITVKIVYCIAVFIGSLFVLGSLMNRGNTDMTMVMPPSTLPVISFKYDGMILNTMHGYTAQMDTSQFGDEITPLMPGRKVSLYIENFGTGVNKIRYELRSVDGSRLIEDTTVYNYLTSDGIITADITLKDLIEDDIYYSLCIILELNTGQTARYYTRIIKSDDLNVSEKLAYAYNFSETTFEKGSGANELKTYLESNSKGDNSTFHRVDIHSSLDQVTWGSLNPELEGIMRARICEINKLTGILQVDYYVSTGEKDSKVYYAVTDYYRIRMGSDRIYLLEYYRDMNQIFSLSSGIINNNKIVLGITDENVNRIESSDGGQLAFVADKRLYSYNIADNKLVQVFGFFEDGKETSIREGYRDNNIRLFSIDDQGNIYFAVYGYMNRGIHEGRMGVAVYYYDSLINNTEEKVFIEYNGNFNVFEQQINTLFYVNTDETGYIYLDGTIYSINLNGPEINVLVQNIPFGGLVVSDDYKMAAYVSGGDLYNSSQIIMLNLVTGSQTFVQAGEDNRVKTIGFFGNDLIYGIARKNDIYKNSLGNMEFPMNTIIIRDEKGNILKEYAEDGIYIMDTELDETMVSLKRAIKTEAGFASITNDQILNNKNGKTERNTIEVVITDTYETIVQLAVRNQIDTKAMKILKPRQIIYEGSRQVTPEAVSYMDGSWYRIYAMGKLIGVTDSSAEAVRQAYDNNGSVRDYEGNILYSRTVYATRNQIMAITGSQIREDEDVSASLPVCLNTMLELNGKNEDTRRQIRNGEDPGAILNQYLENAYIIELSKCDENTAHYYIEKDIPVLAHLSNGYTYLLIGYNEIAVVVMDPVLGTIYKVDTDEIRKWFEDEGNRFITYTYINN